MAGPRRATGRYPGTMQNGCWQNHQYTIYRDTYFRSQRDPFGVGVLYLFVVRLRSLFGITFGSFVSGTERMEKWITVRAAVLYGPPTPPHPHGDAIVTPAPINLNLI